MPIAAGLAKMVRWSPPAVIRMSEKKQWFGNLEHKLLDRINKLLNCAHKFLFSLTQCTHRLAHSTSLAHIQFKGKLNALKGPAQMLQVQANNPSNSANQLPAGRKHSSARKAGRQSGRSHHMSY